MWKKGGRLNVKTLEINGYLRDFTLDHARCDSREHFEDMSQVKEIDYFNE